MVFKFRSNSHWVIYKLCNASQVDHPSKPQKGPSDDQTRSLYISGSPENRSKEQVIAVRRVTGRRGGRGIRGTIAVSAKAEAEEAAPAAQREEQSRGGGSDGTSAVEQLGACAFSSRSSWPHQVGVMLPGIDGKKCIASCEVLGTCHTMHFRR